jgi:hypothetical protein
MSVNCIPLPIDFTINWKSLYLWDLPLSQVSILKTRKIQICLHSTDMTSITQHAYLYCKLVIIEDWPKQRPEGAVMKRMPYFFRSDILTQTKFTLMLRSSPQTHPFAVDTSALWRMQSRVRYDFDINYIHLIRTKWWRPTSWWYFVLLVQSNSVITSWKGLNILCRYKRVLLITEEYNVMVKSEELIGTTEYLAL